jgi:hypothetical protein
VGGATTEYIKGSPLASFAVRAIALGVSFVTVTD